MRPGLAEWNDASPPAEFIPGERQRPRDPIFNAMGMPNKPSRSRDPRVAAVVNQNGCTGCEACLTVCPVDCIETVPGAERPGLFKLVEIDLDRCIGCGLCPKICPWDTITMEPYPKAREVAPFVTLRSVVPGQHAAVAAPV